MTKPDSKQPNTTPPADRKPTGAGAEAARGINTVSGEKREETGKAKGSEPLSKHTEQVHKPSYGGEGGKPRTSSDQREPKPRPKQ